MDDLSAPAGSDAERRTGLTFSSIGVEVEEPLFLDEAESDSASGAQPDPPSPFDLFADEEDLRPAAETILGKPSPIVRGSVRASEGSPLVRQAAPAKPAVHGRELFTQSSSPSHRISLVALFVVVAATTMFVTVQACKVNSAPGTANVAQPGR